VLLQPLVGSANVLESFLCLLAAAGIQGMSIGVPDERKPSIRPPDLGW
jgi:hypothetical protein